MINSVCGKCLYFSAFTSNADKGKGECRFSPPITVVDNDYQIHPIVKHSHWCGDWTSAKVYRDKKGRPIRKTFGYIGG